ncbi:MAG: hypothetical protein NTW16_19040, partial [Bacteroidetes bacterium]|nr:hypothetical protein [Bacteroidota bacterium]
WKVNGNNVSGATNSTYTYVPAHTNTVLCVLTSSLPCTTGSPATSNTITMTVHDYFNVSVGIAASANPVCAGTSVTYTATPVNGGTTPAYQWKVNGTAVTGATNSTYSYVPTHTNTILCVLTSSLPCTTGSPATSNTITMTVYDYFNVSVGIVASANPVCAGTSVTYTATPVNGGTTPAYQWKVNGTAVTGATNSVYSYVPTNGNAIQCVLTSSLPCTNGSPAASNTIAMTVYDYFNVSVGIAASANPVCAGASVTYTATPVNGGTTPSYQWKVNGNNVSGATNSTYSYVPTHGNTILCVLTSSLPCTNGNPATSNTITMTVHDYYTVSVSIVAAANPVCAGTSVTYTATPVNGGPTPAYQWKVNGTDVQGATNSTYSYVPTNGNTILCVLTSSLPCRYGSPATSNTITMTVNPLEPVSISIAASDNPVCAGTSVTFTATPTNGGTSPVYQWKVNGTPISGVNNPSYTYVPTNGNAITCSLTSNATCPTGNPATSNTVNMTVNNYSGLVVSVAITASANNVCAGTSITFTATPTNGGTSPGYQWKVNGTAVTGATNSTYSYVPVNGNSVTCVLSSSLICPTGTPATSNAIVMIINPILPVSATISASANPVCAGTSVTYTVTPVNGGTNPTYQWKVNGSKITGATNTTYTHVPTNNNIINCTLTSNEVCKSGSPAVSNSITMSVTTNLVVSVSIVASANSVCAGTSITYTATPTNGGTAPTYQWRVNSTNMTGATNSTFTYVPANGNTINCVMTSSLTCKTGSPATSNTVTMILFPIVPLGVTIVASANPVFPLTSVTFTATVTNGGSSPTYQWRVDGVNVGTNSSTYTFVPPFTVYVDCIVTTTASCVTGSPVTSNLITMVVNFGVPCTSTPTVVHGGKTYNTVQIGTQCWLKENLDYGTMKNHTVVSTNNGVIEKYCYNDLTSNCDIYGGLYQWNEMMNYVTTPKAQGICPTGWHVPDSLEFATLSTFLGGNIVSGSKIKEAGTTHFQPTNTDANNVSGFTALPNGYLYGNATFASQTSLGYFYTSTTNPLDNTWAYFRSVGYSTPSFGLGNNYKTTTAAVRCLKN